jgi:hypothetical protein
MEVLRLPELHFDRENEVSQFSFASYEGAKPKNSKNLLSPSNFRTKASYTNVGSTIDEEEAERLLNNQEERADSTLSMRSKRTALKNVNDALSYHKLPSKAEY